MSGDMLAVLWTTVAVVLVTGAIGAGVLQAVRHRSLLLSIVVAALVPVAGVSAAVAVNVNQMLISTHDTQVVSAALISASLLAVLLSYVLGRRVASGSRELTAALRGLSAASDARRSRHRGPCGCPVLRSRRADRAGHRAGVDPVQAARLPRPRAGPRAQPPRARGLHVARPAHAAGRAPGAGRGAGGRRDRGPAGRAASDAADGRPDERARGRPVRAVPAQRRAVAGAAGPPPGQPGRGGARRRR